MTAPDTADFGDLMRAAAAALRSAEVWERFVLGLPGPVQRRIAIEFFAWQAHRGQIEPPGFWRTWLLMAGRGFGKTLAGAHWVLALARAHPGTAVALIGGSRDETVKVMVEGPSGLIANARAGEIARWTPTRGVLRFASGAEAFVYSAGTPEGLRGPQHHFAWCDELAKWPSAKGGARGRGEAAWDNLQMGLRLGERPRTIVTTTPRDNALVRRVKAAGGTVTTRGRTAQNVHLAEGVRAWLEETYGGTRLGRQELDGVLFDAPAGALWSRELIEKSRVPSILPGTDHRVDHAPHDQRSSGGRSDPMMWLGAAETEGSAAQPPALRAGPSTPRCASGPPPRSGEDLRRVVVGVDPPVSADGDACGIVVCGVDQAGVAYVLADCSAAGLSPEGWARAVARAAADWGADRVVAEKNQGGDMVASVLTSVEANLPVKLVSASRGKAARAEPVAARFETGKAKLAGRFPELEDELAGLILGGGYEGPGRSPDRADAMVWAMTELRGSLPQPSVRGF